MGRFRLVRLLGSGARSRVFLGHDGSGTAAIKVFRPGAAPESIDDEIAALSSASHAHVVQLREVATAASGLPYLVLERLESSSIETLLASRPTVAAGEAVTMLAPVIAAIGALHSSGVAHGSIAPARVLFRASGAPVLTGFGRATLFVPPSSAAMLSTSRPVLDDRLALGRLVATVVSRCDNDAGLRTWLSACERDGFPDGFTESLLARVFELGQATPVRSIVPAPVTIPERPSAAVTGARDEVPTHGTSARVMPRVRGSRAAGVLAGLRSRIPVDLSIGSVLGALRTVRRPLWVAAGVGISSLVAALLLMPPSTGQAAPSPTSASAPSSHDTPEDRSTSAVAGDDPAAALAALLTERTRCIRDLSILCLEAVAQSGSAALDDDAALIRSIEKGETAGVIAIVDTASITLVERHGDAALLSFTAGEKSEPASALLVKGEAGWRIRDYLTG